MYSYSQISMQPIFRNTPFREIGWQISLCFILAFTLFSCKQAGTRQLVKVVDDFPENYSLNSLPTNISTNYYPMMLTVVDTLLLICDTENEPFFHIYNLKYFEHISSFGEWGHGPSDFADPVFWHQFVIKDSTFYIWIFELNNLTLKKISLSEAIDNNIPGSIPFSRILLPAETFTTSCVLVINDSMVVGTGHEARGEFFVFDIRSEQLSWKPFIKDLPESIWKQLVSEGLLNEYKLGTMSAKADGSKFIRTYIYNPIVDVYDSSFERIFSIKTGNPQIPSINRQNKQFDKHTRIFYIGSFATNEYIYLLNANCTLNDYLKGDCSSFILEKFDWKGNPIAKFSLNERVFATGSFAIDVSRNRLLTINPDFEHEAIRVFNLQ